MYLWYMCKDLGVNRLVGPTNTHYTSGYMSNFIIDTHGDPVVLQGIFGGNLCGNDNKKWFGFVTLEIYAWF